MTATRRDQTHLARLDPRGNVPARDRPWASSSSRSPTAQRRRHRRRCTSARHCCSSAVSATYHRFNWKPKAKLLLKRIDHSNIFLLIAGTYTPIAVLEPPARQGGHPALARLGRGASLGIAFRVFWTSAPRWLYTPLYVLLGVGALLYVRRHLIANNPASMILVLAGGLLYIIGAVVLRHRSVRIPCPGVFGFHELFHALTVLAFLCHWTAVLLVAI